MVPALFGREEDSSQSGRAERSAKPCSRSVVFGLLIAFMKHCLPTTLADYSLREEVRPIFLSLDCYTQGSHNQLQVRVLMGRLPAGTVTFLFTDIEGSTGLWEKHPEAMKDAIRRHPARQSNGKGENS